MFAYYLWLEIITFLRDIALESLEAGIELLNEGIGQAFNTERASARIRKVTLIGLGALTWIIIALINHPPRLGADLLPDIISYPFRAMFAADVFKHILIAALAFWVAYRIAAIYLDDIFELENVPLAARFIRQSAFAGKYDLIEINNVKVGRESEQSPIFRIGGPGRVRVYLEFAALFEKIDGTPHLVSPTDGIADLEGFERLREVIDLRDQMMVIEDVCERTRDGIRVNVKNVRMVFSVLRGGAEPTLAVPYPFVGDAIEALVYENPFADIALTMETLIHSEMSSFISQHTLSEFLAAVNLPEIENELLDRAELQANANVYAGVENALDFEEIEVPDFVPRDEVTGMFFAPLFDTLAEDHGIQLHWIDVGTWVTPTPIIPERHQTAWRLTRENLMRGSPEALERLQNESRFAELRALIKEVPLKAFSDLESGEQPPQEIVRKLIWEYRKKLQLALDLYERDDEFDLLEAQRLHCILLYLIQASAYFAGGQ